MRGRKYKETQQCLGDDGDDPDPDYAGGFAGVYLCPD